MKLLTSRDASSALITGLTTGVIAWQIMSFVDVALPFGIPHGAMVSIVPLLWLAGIQFGYLLSSALPPMAQFARFCAIGLTNAAVDFGVLYLFIAQTGRSDGTEYSLFKAVSFFVATIHSYFWNKFWAFNASHSGGGTTEVARFVLVATLSIVINVFTASIVVALRPETFAPNAWAGVAAIVGSGTALIFSFIGFRLFVFKKK